MLYLNQEVTCSQASYQLLNNFYFKEFIFVKQISNMS